LSTRLTTALSRLLYAVVPVEVSGRAGVGVGTAFLFSSEHGSGTVPVLVANRSLIERADTGRFYFTRGDGDQAVSGEHLAFEMEQFSTIWHPHPDPGVDLAVAPFGPVAAQLQQAGRTAFVSFLDRRLVAAVEDPDIDVIEEVLVLGFIGGLIDERSILPVTQKGVTASPFQRDYAGTRGFLVQFPVYPSVGGSPVVVMRRRETQVAEGIERVTDFRLIGVITDVAEWRDGGVRFIPVPPAPPREGAAWLPFARAIRAEAIGEVVDDLIKTHLGPAEPEVP
jgi:hypothetical protein